MKALNLLLSSKGFPVKDRTAALIGMKMRGGTQWPITTLTGSLPLTYESRVKHILKNYVLYGTSAGAGVETENIWSDEDARLRYWISANGVLDTNNRFGAVSTDIIVNPGDVISFAFFGEGHRSHFIAFYDANGFVSREYTPDETSVHTVSPGITRCYLGVATENDVSRSGLISIKSVWQKSSTAPTAYIPFGYKIPLTNTGENSQSETYPIYIGSTKLGEEEYVDYATQKIYKKVEGVLTPTDPPVPFPAITAYKGENTLSSTETVGECSVTGRIKETET